MQYEIELPKLKQWQQDAFNRVINDNGAGKTYCVKAKRQVGKSVLAITVLLYFAFKNEGSIGILTEPVMHQSRRVYRQLINAIGGDDSPLIKSANATLLEITFINGSQILFKSVAMNAAVRGFTVHKSCLVIDEGAYCPDDFYFEIDPVTDATKNPTLIISTPLFESGEFYERYIRGIKGSPFVESFDWGKYDTSVFLPPEKLEYYRENMTEMKFRSEILGEFLSEKSYVFGDFAACTGYSSKPARYCGVDWSQGEDNDYTVAVFLDEDCRMTDIKMYKDFSPVELIGALAADINGRDGMKVVNVEKNSMGHVYYDMLKRQVKQGVSVREFNTTNESKRRVIEQLIKAFETEDISILPDAELKRQLQNYGIEKLKNGGYTYNGQNGVHDDAVIALALAYDVAKKSTNKFSIGFA